MKEPEKYRRLHGERCDICGRCLRDCPYMTLSRDEAVRQMEHLLAGREAPRIRRNCTGCMACSAACPRGLHPYELILLQWHRRYRRDGLPLRVAYALPHFSPHFRADLVRSLDDRGRTLVRRWRGASPRGEIVLYPGCNLLTLPHLLDTSLLSGVRVAGRWDLCCGEMYYRLGLFSAVRQIARRLTEYYRDRDIDTMLFACPACYRMFSEILPRQFGARFPFRVRFLAGFLRDRLRERGASVQAGGRFAFVHDSCHARLAPEKLRGEIRRLLPFLSVREAEGGGTQDAFCCGAAAAARRHHLWDMARTSFVALRGAAGTGAEEILVYCAGCELHLALWRKLRPGSLPVRHVLQRAREAIGEDPAPPASRTTDRLLLTGLYRLLPRYFSRRTLRVEEHLPSPDGPLREGGSGEGA